MASVANAIVRYPASVSFFTSRATQLTNGSMQIHGSGGQEAPAPSKKASSNLSLPKYFIMPAQSIGPAETGFGSDAQTRR